MLHAFCCGISPAKIALVLEIMVHNPTQFCHGFPDLFLWNEKSGSCVFWEVKGPGDVIRPEQDFWLREFNRHGFVAAVAYVKYLS